MNAHASVDLRRRSPDIVPAQPELALETDKERCAAMLSRQLGDTGIVTTAMGFGCAGLFHSPQRRERRRLLETAYEMGIRHFDVAPSYGLGRAEPELGDFIRSRRSDLTVTTKFGIEPTAFGRASGFAQSPVRRVLRRLPQVQTGLRTAAAGPGAGLAGRVLYRSSGSSAASAQASLTRSLHALGTDYVDIFLLHEPHLLGDDPRELADSLNNERDRGRILAWGTAGDLVGSTDLLSGIVPGSQVVQHRDELHRDLGALLNAQGLARVTFGVLIRTLAALTLVLGDEPTLAKSWSDALGDDVTRSDVLVSLLLREALRRNQSGPVLFTTTKVDRLSTAVAAASDTQSAAERRVVGEMSRHLRRRSDPVGD